MELNQFEYISWPKLHRLCFKLSQKIETEKIKPDRIVAISRGGIVVARILGDFLNLPIRYITMVSTEGIGNLKTPVIVEGLSSQVADEKILLVDEIGDSGETIVKAKEHLRNFRPQKVYSAVPVIKPHTQPKPDFYMHTTHKWVVFPYEVRETIEELVKQWKQAGLGRKEINDRLTSLGFTKPMVDRFLRK